MSVRPNIGIWAQTAAKIGFGSFGVLLTAALLTLLYDVIAFLNVEGPHSMWMPGLGYLSFFFLRVLVRRRMRKNLKQTGKSAAADLAWDACVHCYPLAPFATAQEALFVEHYEAHYPLVEAV